MRKYGRNGWIERWMDDGGWMRLYGGETIEYEEKLETE